MIIRHFISTHQELVQVALYAVIITGLWLTEVMISGGFFHLKWQHSRVNLMFIFTALPIQLFLTGFVVLIIGWTNQHHWGLINFIPFHQNLWVYYISLFILLDFCEYCYHVIMHKTDFLWKFHLVHHSDLAVDVSTTVREHPGETIMRTCFSMLWVFLLGPAVGVLVLRQSVQSFSNISAHTTFRLPRKINNIIGKVFITPNLHHVHHHYQLPHTDRNYGDVLSIWDRLFGTFGELEERDTVFGIDTHMEPATNGIFMNTLKIPFQKLTRPEGTQEQS
ncbi:sterol desaturase family protein [Mucilaginibacter sp.]|uniref:sterol desaturase family protein n=1 Tax=Mucilaginibacter sp. TaxID=1882438 RepID=UPI003AFFFA19